MTLPTAMCIVVMAVNKSELHTQKSKQRHHNDSRGPVTPSKTEPCP